VEGDRRGRLAKGWLTKGEKFAVPPGVVMKDIEYFTGLLPAREPTAPLKEAFVAGTEPNRQYDNAGRLSPASPGTSSAPSTSPRRGVMAPAAPGSPAGTVPGEKPGREGQVVGEGDEGRSSAARPLSRER